MLSSSCEIFDGLKISNRQTDKHYLVYGHVYSCGHFLKKASYYDNFNCYALGIAKPVVGTSENLAEPYYDIIKMAAILNLNENLLCIKISLILGQFLNLRFQNVQSEMYYLLIFEKNMAEPNDDVSKMATILDLNKNMFCLIIALILGHFLKN